MPPVDPIAEPGFTTTEFWGKVIVQVVGAITLFGPLFGLHIIPVNTSDPVVQQEITYGAGILAIVVPELIYIIGRSIRKAGSTSPPHITK